MYSLLKEYACISPFHLEKSNTSVVASNRDTPKLKKIFGLYHTLIYINKYLLKNHIGKKNKYNKEDSYSASDSSEKTSRSFSSGIKMSVGGKKSLDASLLAIKGPYFSC